MMTRYIRSPIHFSCKKGPIPALIKKVLCVAPLSSIVKVIAALNFSLEEEKEILDSFFQQEEIEENLNNSVKKGFDFFAFVRDCREKLEVFLTKQENNENKQDSVEASAADVYKSANKSFIAKNLENNREIKIEEKSSNQTSDRNSQKA